MIWAFFYVRFSAGTATDCQVILLGSNLSYTTAFQNTFAAETRILRDNNNLN